MTSVRRGEKQNYDRDSGHCRAQAQREQPSRAFSRRSKGPVVFLKPLLRAREHLSRLAFFLAAAMPFALSACAGPPVVTASSVACSSLLPPDWKQGVAGADLPDGNVLADWIVFGDAQTGKLDQANGRTKDAIGIVERCEARDAAAVKRATRGFFGKIFG